METSESSIENAFLKTTLDNGLRVVTNTMSHTRSVTIGAYVGVGSRYESAEQAGLSHFIEHLVFKGTERRPDPGEISGQVEGVGGVMNAGTEQELTVYWCKVARLHLDDCLDLLIDMLRNSLYTPEDVEKERLVLLEELAMVNDHPGSRADVMIDEMLWPDHPLGREVGGTEQSVVDITRDMVVDHVARFYTPSNIVISVAGDVEHDQVVELVEGLTNGWSRATPYSWDPFTDKQQASELRVEYRKTEQAHLSIGLPGVSITHPDVYTLDLLSAVLGEGMSSRLFIEVRERLGLAYDVGCSVAHFQDCGAVVINAGVDPKRVYQASETILHELELIRNGVPEDELEKAKRMSIGRLFLRMEDTRSVSGWMGSQESLLGEVLDIDDVVSRVEGVTPEDVRRVANELIVADKLNMAVVGPNRGGSRLRGLLERSVSAGSSAVAAGAG